MAQKQTDAQKIAALQAKLATVAKTRTDSSRRGPVSEALRSLGIECPWKMAQVTLNVEVEWPTEIGTGAVDESNAYVASRWLYDQDRDGLQAAITSITPVPTEAVDASTLPTTYTEYVTLVGEVFSRMVADQNWCLDGHYYVKRATDLDLPVIVHEVTGSITDEAGKELWSWTRTHRGGAAADALHHWSGDMQDRANSDALTSEQFRWLRFRDFYGATPITTALQAVVTSDDGSVTLTVAVPALDINGGARTITATVRKATVAYSTIS